MSESLETDLRAARIKHSGQCPHERGHCTQCVLSAICTTAAITFIIAMFVTVIADNPEGLRQEAIKRGHAIHNPVTGKWQWK